MPGLWGLGMRPIGLTWQSPASSGGREPSKRPAALSSWMCRSTNAGWQRTDGRFPPTQVQCPGNPNVDTFGDALEHMVDKPCASAGPAARPCGAVELPAKSIAVPSLSLSPPRPGGLPCPGINQRPGCQGEGHCGQITVMSIVSLSMSCFSMVLITTVRHVLCACLYTTLHGPRPRHTFHQHT